MTMTQMCSDSLQDEMSPGGSLGELSEERGIDVSECSWAQVRLVSVSRGRREPVVLEGRLMRYSMYEMRLS